LPNGKLIIMRLFTISEGKYFGIWFPQVVPKVIISLYDNIMELGIVILL
jgi:hypothetical protein